MNKWKAFKLEHEITGKISYAHGTEHYMSSQRFKTLRAAKAAARSMNRFNYDRQTTKVETYEAPWPK